MATVTTDRPVNISQLCYELGTIPLHAVGPTVDGETTISTDAVTDVVLGAAVDAHVADPAWVDPDALPPAPSAKDIARQKLAAVPGGPIKVALEAIIEAL